MKLHTNTMNTGLVIICYQIVYNKWCVTGVKHMIFVVMIVHMLPLITRRGRCHNWKQERRSMSCDMLWLWMSHFRCFPITSVPLWSKYIITITTISYYVLVCIDILHKGYQPIHHVQVSLCVHVDSHERMKKRSHDAKTWQLLILL